MWGLGFGITGSVTAVWLSWKSYLRVADPAECNILQSFLRSSEMGARGSPNSRPRQLLDELRSIHANGDAQVAVLNDTLKEVDSQTRVGQKAITSLSRVAFFAGMAGATAEVAGNAGYLGYTVFWAGTAFAVGAVAAIVCTVIGHRATRDIRFRRQLWDDFVRRILNSDFSRTELNVLGFCRNQADGGGQPENSDVESGQHSAFSSKLERN